MMITDMIIVGRLGSRELAAVGLTADWFYVLLLIGMGVISIVGVVAAQHLGAGNRRSVAVAAEQGMVVATLLSVPVLLAMWYLGPVLGWARQDSEVVRLITDYSRPLTLSVVPALWFAVLRNYVTALARAGVIMWITVVALVLNLILNYALVFGRLGMPALGVVGAAYGTTIVTWLMYVALALHITRSALFADYRLSWLPRRLEPAVIREIVSLGLPVSATQILSAGMFTVAAVLVGMLSADILAAQQIVYTVMYVALSGAIAIGDAVRVRVAYGIGLRSVPAARQSAGIAFAFAAVISLAAAGALWQFPEALIGVFLDTRDAANAGVLAIGAGIAVWGAAFMLFDGIQIVLANAVRGLRDTRSPLYISTIGYWVIGLGSGSWLCFRSGHGEDGMWWGLVAGVVAATVLMAVKFLSRMRHTAAALAGITDR